MIVVLVMILGVIFVAHKYYHDFGGQGFLKYRGSGYFEQREGDYANKLYLPLRKVETWDLEHVVWGKRSPERNVPFYQCGDQMNSCEEYYQPVSGVFCPLY